MKNKTIIKYENGYNIKDEELKQLLDGKLVDEIEIKGNTIVKTYNKMPNDSFLQKQVDELFKKRIKENSSNLLSFLGLVSEREYSYLTEEFLNGTLNVKFISFIPFLSKNDLRKVALRLIKCDSYKGLKFETIIPFLSRTFLKECVNTIVTVD